MFNSRTYFIIDGQVSTSATFSNNKYHEVVAKPLFRAIREPSHTA